MGWFLSGRDVAGWPVSGMRGWGLAAVGFRGFRMTGGRPAGGGYLLEFVRNKVVVAFGGGAPAAAAL